MAILLIDKSKKAFVEKNECFLKLFHKLLTAALEYKVKSLTSDLTCYNQLSLSCYRQITRRIVALANYPIIIPAMVADIKEAIVPPISAFIPNSESVFRCPGAKDPIPPI